MDFSQLSKETMELSEQIGKKQLQLLFDENYFCREISLSKESSKQTLREIGPGVGFFLDKGTGSFCLRGEALTSHTLIENQKELEKLNGHFKKTDQIHWFSCESYGQAQIIVDQMMNRRFPYQHEVICNISDPGGNWWLEESENRFTIYFKSMGRASELKNIGPLGDPEVAKYRWGKASDIFNSSGINVELETNEHSLVMKTPSGQKKSKLEKSILNLFIKGENALIRDDYSGSMEDLSLFLYLNEIAQIRKFWLSVEELLDTSL